MAMRRHAGDYHSPVIALHGSEPWPAPAPSLASPTGDSRASSQAAINRAETITVSASGHP